jgi:hypothetical protein
MVAAKSEISVARRIISAVMATAELTRASEAERLIALAVAYRMPARLRGVAPARQRGVAYTRTTMAATHAALPGEPGISGASLYEHSLADLPELLAQTGGGHPL